MLSLSGCKCQRDASGVSGIMPDAQCRSAYNNGNERRNMVYANARIYMQLPYRQIYGQSPWIQKRNGAITQKLKCLLN